MNADARPNRSGLGSRHIAYYVTAHGYGHGVRSCDIIRALNELDPDLRVTIVSDLPESFFRNRLPGTSNVCRSGSFDVGMVQLDSIRVDVAASLAKAELLLRRRKELIVQETEFLKQGAFGLVVADIPAIPLEAAARAGVPGIAVGNFSWDWIYSAYVGHDPGWGPIVAAFAQGYGCSDLLLRLPFAGEMRAFRRVESLPLLAMPGQARRREIAEFAVAPPDVTWLLLSFTTLEWSEEALDRVEQLHDCCFFTVLPLAWKRKNFRAVDRERMPFADVVASVDAVISKPGFGIVSECIVNRKPLIYADRSDFLEYAPLETGVRKYVKHVHIPAEQLYRGELRASLDALKQAPEPAHELDAGGAAIAARRITDFLPAVKKTSRSPRRGLPKT